MTLVIMSSPLIGLCFSMNLCLHLCSFLLRADWWKSHSSVNGEPQGNWRWNSISKDVFVSSPFFSLHTARAPQRACSQARFLVPHLLFLKVSTLLISISWHHICNFSFTSFLFICLFCILDRTRIICCNCNRNN